MSSRDSQGDVGESSAGFTRWYLTLMLGIVAALSGLLLFFSAVTPLVVGGSGFVGGNMLVTAGIAFVGSLLVVISLPPAADGAEGSGGSGAAGSGEV